MHAGPIGFAGSSILVQHVQLGTGLLFYLLCYAAVLKILTCYAQYYVHVKELCLKSDCSIRVYLLVLIW